MSQLRLSIKARANAAEIFSRRIVLKLNDWDANRAGLIGVRFFQF